MAELPPKCQIDLGTDFTLKKFPRLCVNEDEYISNQYGESPVSTSCFHQVKVGGPGASSQFMNWESLF